MQLFSFLTAEALELAGAGRSLRAGAAGPALPVHLSADVVAARAVVARVQLAEPLALAVLGQAAAHAVRVGPRQGGVVTDRLLEPEPMDFKLIKAVYKSH